MKVVCAWCNPGKLQIEGKDVSHGICEKHKKEFERQLADVRKKQQNEKKPKA